MCHHQLGEHLSQTRHYAMMKKIVRSPMKSQYIELLRQTETLQSRIGLEEGMNAIAKVLPVASNIRRDC
jgi:hypothetical protein